VSLPETPSAPLRSLRWRVIKVTITPLENYRTRKCVISVDTYPRLMHNDRTTARAAVRARRERRSGGATFIVVMQTADVWDWDDRTAGWRLGRPGYRSILVQREVSAPLVIVGEVVLQVAVQRALVPHDDVIEALASEGANHTFNERIGVSCRLHRGRAVRHKPFGLPIPSIRSVAGRFS
jgi:hypothetical protein